MTEHAIGRVDYDATPASMLALEARNALEASDLTIDSDQMLTIAGDDLKAIKALQKRVEEKRLGITGPLSEAVKAINELFRAPKDYLDQAEASLKRAILCYTAEQEKIATDLRRKADEAARAERDRLMSEQRAHEAVAREAQLAAVDARQTADAARRAGDLTAADEAEQNERREGALAETAQAQADSAAQTAEVWTMPVLQATTSKISGVSGRTTYSAVVLDLMALVNAVANGVAPPQSIKPDEKFLGAQARAFKRVGPIYPGVTAIAERSLAARTC